MRVTGGELKGRQLLPGFANHVRPSTDRVRESLFNSLQNQINLSETTVLDLFSGSGIIALEFLSRYTASVTSVDLDKKNIAYQKHIRQEWKIAHQNLSQKTTETLDVNASMANSTTPMTITGNWEIIMADIWKFIPKVNETFDVIFADPPYHMPNVQQLPSLLLPLLNPQNPDALLLFEHKPQLQFPSANTPHAVKVYGSSIISFFRP
jgi:16S rRNA (guanine966-N2)-methyltransferase